MGQVDLKLAGCLEVKGKLTFKLRGVYFKLTLVVLQNRFSLCNFLLSQKYKLLFLMFPKEFRSKIIKVPFMNHFWYQPSSIHFRVQVYTVLVYTGVCNDICLKAELRNLIWYKSVLFFIFIVIINVLYHLLFIFPWCNEFYLLFIFPWCNENMSGIRERRSIFPEMQRKEGAFSRKASLRWSFTILKFTTDTSLCMRNTDNNKNIFLSKVTFLCTVIVNMPFQF